MKYSLFLSVLIGFFSLAGLHNVQAQLCDGVDLRSTLSVGEREQIRQQADSIPNARGRFWKIEKPGVPPSWLIGTMHVSDRRVRELSQAEQAAFNMAERVALELDVTAESDLEGASGLLKLLNSYPEKFTYRENNVIKNALPAPQFAMFEEALKQRGLSYTLLSRTKPWLIFMILGQPPCMMAPESLSYVAFDDHLGKTAQDDGKQVIGLETIEEQLLAIDSLPLDFYVTSIIQLAHLTDQLNNYYETMLALYLDGEIGAIMPTMMALMVRDLEEAGLADAEMPNPADMLGFETILLDERNAVMAERAAPLLEAGNSFIAVGALHLVGENGLVERFRRLGYEVSRGE